MTPSHTDPRHAAQQVTLAHCPVSSAANFALSGRVSHVTTSGRTISVTMNQNGPRASSPRAVMNPGICDGGAARVHIGCVAIASAKPNAAKETLDVTNEMRSEDVNGEM